MTVPGSLLFPQLARLDVAGVVIDPGRCTECGALYGYRHHYEFLIGHGGSYDEYFLWKLAGAPQRGQKTWDSER
jgi:hypothetical protein